MRHRTEKAAKPPEATADLLKNRWDFRIAGIADDKADARSQGEASCDESLARDISTTTLTLPQP